jgi:hypothetical protein
MIFKSLDLIVQEARETFRRFPLAILSSLVGTLAMVLWVNFNRQHHHSDLDYFWKLGMVSTLGITLFLSLVVFSEVKAHDARKTRMVQTFGLLLLAAYYVSLIGGGLKGADFYRFYLINTDLHLLVAIAPFLFERALTNAFWQYNKTLFIRIGICAIYSSTIYIGLVIAIVCLNNLFNLHIKEDIYLQLWFMVVGIFNTWFFLAGVPASVPLLETKEDYPKGLKIFTQFILIPLVVLYYVILYLYMAKIIFTWTLPVGWLSSFIIGASLLGILTLLLIYPLRDRSEHGWIKGYAKNFYLALLPLVALMAVAIFRRVFDYGITVERYFVLLFTVWLFYISIKFTFRPNTSIRLIPTSMCILIVMATFGPLSAVNVSSQSQLGRLGQYLSKSGHLINGKLHKGKRKVNFKDSAEISSIVEYLHGMNGLGVLNRWADKGDDFRYMDQYSFCKDYLGIDFIDRYQRSSREGQAVQYFQYSVRQVPLKTVKGFDYVYDLQGFYRNQNGFKTLIQTPDGTLEVMFGEANNSVVFRTGQAVMNFDLDHILNSLKETKGINGYDLDPALMTFESHNDRISIKVVLSSMSGDYQGEVPKVNNLYGQVYLKFKGKE